MNAHSPSTAHRPTRLAKRFAQLRAEGRGALIPYVEAFDPDRATSLALMKAMPEAGADIIEVGVPFSDPAADGPTIQAAAKRALKAGATLAGVLAMVRDFRQHDQETPVVMMGYLNPVDRYGVERFCQEAAQAGVDGLLLVDLPPEEAPFVLPHARAHGLDLIRLATPTTTPERLETILQGASGFLYYVSIKGVTGTTAASADDLAQAMRRIRQNAPLPVVTGFGIATPEQAATAATLSDGAVTASALIKAMAATLDERGNATAATVEAALAPVRAMAQAVRATTNKA
ncbi:tryptophan synthase subunit alpha [Formicincola oecophyllae]|uniref:Tryptophan synthase alpha chain n=1 Tax=Formicincola oecophyllae TaxID=2558361 RepID=A0A4Y6U8K2_9PROT|nr:tryptophan synthase subunit alpha [Formicincola oecophyllae]QDH13320.1 tryptophan synthase subunit alpha [Formicincola oecophyllae]